jgi:hypothetical protein
MQLWEEIGMAAGVIVLLMVGVFMAIFGVAGLSYSATGYAVERTTDWSILYGVILLIGLALVYVGIKRASAAE